MPACRKCLAPLILGENWSQGVEKTRNYICRECNSKKGSEHYRKHVERAALLQRERLRKPAAAAQASATKRAYYSANKARWAAYRETQKAKEASLTWHRAGKILTWARARAASKGIEFDLTREWLDQRLSAGVCEVSGIALELGKPDGQRFHPWAPSVDRVDSRHGYTQENCRVVVWIYNMAKSEWTDADVMKLAQALAK